jgi:periplasmic divalent cation tolerance protein
MDYFMILSTINNKDKGVEIAEALIKKEFAACVNIIDGITSVYKWKEKIEMDNEYLLLVKTVDYRLEETIEKIKTLHPYELPEIISFRVEEGNKEYLKWINEICGGKK